MFFSFFKLNTTNTYYLLTYYFSQYLLFYIILRLILILFYRAQISKLFNIKTPRIKKLEISKLKIKSSNNISAYWFIIIITLVHIMNGFLIPNEIQQEGDIYEDLSQFIKIFKKIMDIATIIVTNPQQPETITLIQQLKATTTENQRFISKYNSVLDESSSHKNTFYRFICRLNQNIQMYKNRPSIKNQASILYRQFLEKTQQSILSYQTNKNIGKIFKKLFYLTNKFCISCQIITTNGFQEEILSYFAKSDEYQQQQNKPAHQYIKSKLSFNSSQSNFHKTMNTLKKRFGTLSCLDLEFNSFKTCYFQSRNQQADLFNQCFQRNAFIWKEVTDYSRLFSQYLKKKSKFNLSRRNRFKDKTDSLKCQSENKEKNDRGKFNETNSFKIKPPKIISKTNQLPMLKDLSSKQDKSERDISKILDINLKDIEVQRRKTHYQVNNVYLTLNQINFQPSKDKQATKKHNKLNKDKLKLYGVLKMGKMSLRSTKYNQSNQHYDKPLLQIKQIQSREYGFMINHSYIQQMPNLSCINPDDDRKQLKTKKCHQSSQQLCQKDKKKKNMLYTKNNKLNRKLENFEDQIIYEDTQIYQIKVPKSQEACKSQK